MKETIEQKRKRILGQQRVDAVVEIEKAVNSLPIIFGDESIIGTHVSERLCSAENPKERHIIAVGLLNDLKENNPEVYNRFQKIYVRDFGNKNFDDFLTQINALEQ